MPNSTNPPIAPFVLVAVCAFTWLLAGWLLATGSARGSVTLLAWGVSAAVLAIAGTCLLVIRSLIDDAVRRAVTAGVAAVRSDVDTAVASTAVRVGEAIASALREDHGHDHLSDHPGVPRLYSGRP